MSLHPDIAAVLAGDSEGCIVKGDCLAPGFLPDMPDGCVDAVVTDPPYGVELGKKPSAIGKIAYRSIDDTPGFVERVAVPAIVRCIVLAKCCLVWTGTRNCFLYPVPDDIGSVYVSAGAGVGKWGFTCSQHFLYYGSDPYLATGKGSRANSFASNEVAMKNGHPCPKPIGWMVWAVNRSSFPGDIILDPFCGSGTTCVAAKKLGRRWIGIEIDEKYCEIARNRVRDTPRPLFTEPKKNPTDATLFGEEAE